jgi:TolB protein
MTDDFDRHLGEELKRLVAGEVPPAGLRERIEARAGRGRRPSRLLAVAAAVLLVSAGVALVASGDDSGDDQKVAAGGPSTTSPDDDAGATEPAETTTTSTVAATTTTVRAVAPTTTVKPAPAGPGRLVAVSGMSVQLVNDDGSASFPVAGGDTFVEPHWSPDGARIAYVRTVGAGPPTDVYAVNADGTGDHKVAPSLYTSGWLSWSPDSKQLAIAGASAEGQPAAIFITNVDGTATRQLTHVVETDQAHSFPAWSPDGTRIAFQSERNGLSVINVDGSNLVKIDTVYPSRFAWSPDSQWIAFHSERGGDVGIIHPDGSGRRVLASGVRSSGDVLDRVEWSPDGRTLAFDAEQGIGLVPLGGGEWRPLEGANGGHHPTWSPDGRRIAFDVINSIQSVNVDGSDGRAAGPGSYPEYRRR